MTKQQQKENLRNYNKNILALYGIDEEQDQNEILRLYEHYNNVSNIQLEEENNEYIYNHCIKRIEKREKSLNNIEDKIKNLLNDNFKISFYSHLMTIETIDNKYNISRI